TRGTARPSRDPNYSVRLRQQSPTKPKPPLAQREGARANRRGDQPFFTAGAGFFAGTAGAAGGACTFSAETRLNSILPFIFIVILLPNGDCAAAGPLISMPTSPPISPTDLISRAVSGTMFIMPFEVIVPAMIIIALAASFVGWPSCPICIFIGIVTDCLILTVPTPPTVSSPRSVLVTLALPNGVGISESQL